MQQARLIHKFLIVSGSAAAVVLLLGLIVERQFEAAQPDLKLIRIMVWGAVLIATALIFVVAFLQVRMVSNRIQRVLHGMEDIRNGKYPHLVVESKDEVAELVRGFNQTVEELRDRDDKLKSWAGHRENELVKLSQIIEEERERLEAVLASIGDGVIVLDSENKVIMANRTVSEIFGVPMEALNRADLGKLIEQVKHRLVAPEAVEQKMRDLQKDPSLVDEITLELDDPGGPAIRLYSAPVRGADGKMLGRIATSLDLGREREIDRLKSEFLSTISHELRTPLTSVKGALGLVRGGAVGTVSSEMKELLDIALTNTDRLIRVINDILDIFQLERGQARIRPVNMTLTQSVTRALRAIQSLADLRKVRIESDLPATLPTVKADPKRIEQVLVNLLTNAVKFSQPEGIIQVRAKVADEMVQVSVQDHGRGMKPEFLDRLFVKFEHAQGSLTRENQGAGLGLAICRHVVNAHGGKIWAESEGEGKGSTFHFTLPASDSKGALGLLGGKQMDPQLAVRRLILVIDDDEDVARVIGYVFETMGHRVLTAHNGKEAIALASKHHPDMITLDLVMPELDGYAVLRTLRAAEDTRHIPIICISMETDPGQAIAAGADYYMEKPVDIEKLRDVAARAMAGLQGG